MPDEGFGRVVNYVRFLFLSRASAKKLRTREKVRAGGGGGVSGNFLSWLLFRVFD